MVIRMVIFVDGTCLGGACVNSSGVTAHLLLTSMAMENVL